MPPLLPDMLHLGPIGFVLVGSPIVALVASVVACCSRSAPGRVACAAAAAAAGVSMLAAWAGVHGARGRFLDHVLRPDPSAVTWPSLDLARAAVAEHAGAGTALLLVPVLATAAAVTWARASRDVSGRWLAAGFLASLAVPAWLVAFASFAATRAVLYLPFDEVGPQHRYDSVLSAAASLDAMRSWLVAVGGAGALVAVVLAAIAARRGDRLPSKVRLACLALGAVGLLAYARTRGAAEDAAHPLSFEEPAPPPGLDPDRLPLVRRDCAPVDGVFVSVSSDGARSVFGVPTSDVGERLRAQRSLWMSVHPRRAFVVAVVIAAPADTLARGPLDVAAIAREAGYADVVAATARPIAAVPSRTLGPIARPTRLCAGSIVGDAGTWDRWGEHVAPP
jgi:hypothetical protein